MTKSTVASILAERADGKQQAVEFINFSCDQEDEIVVIQDEVQAAPKA